MTQLQMPPHPPLAPPQPQYGGGPRPGRALWRAAAAVWVVGITVLAVAALVVASNRTTSAAPITNQVTQPTYAGNQIAAAKDKACTAALRSIAGVRNSSNRAAPTAPDDSLGWANAANARVAMLATSTYLPLQVDAATPQDVKEAINTLSAASGEAASISISEQKSEKFDKAIDVINVASKEIERLCHE